MAGGFAPTCFCSCQDGYRGTNCEIADPCQATSTPTDDGSDGNYYCINGGDIGGTTGSCTCTNCGSDYQGIHCEATSAPTFAPTPAPTSAPTPAPTKAPTAPPTPAPTMAPTSAPTPAPTSAPTAPPTPAPTMTPCSSDPCGENAICIDIFDGEHDFSCVCNPGYGGGGKFVRGEVGKCAGEMRRGKGRANTKTRPSAQDASSIPTHFPNSFHSPLFAGAEILVCVDINCGSSGSCVEGTNGLPACSCNAGFSGSTTTSSNPTVPPNVPSCTSCAAGTFSDAGFKTCDLCASGKYSETPQASFCAACKAGRFNSDQGSDSVTACEACSKGAYSGTAATKCTACDVGKYSNIESSSSCTSCERGKASASIGATSAVTCKVCAAGKASLAASPTCSSCGSNEYSGAGAGLCSTCGRGKHLVRAETGVENKACNETDGCLLEQCPENNICHDILSPATGRKCEYIPFSIIEEEVAIEGLSEEDFPMELSFPFIVQNAVFLLLYMVLALSILVQVMVIEGGLGKAGVMANKHSVTLFVFLGCIVRLVHIYTSDLFPSLSPFRYYKYGLSAVVDIMWFTAFSYLAFFWWELQLKGLKQKVVNVQQTKRRMYATIALFSLLRLGRASSEASDDLMAIIGGKGTCALFLIGFAVFL